MRRSRWSSRRSRTIPETISIAYRCGPDDDPIVCIQHLAVGFTNSSSTAGTAGPDHVVAVAGFSDGSSRVILDTCV